jgi:hypothetical protein
MKAHKLSSYKAYYRTKVIIVEADSSYRAQTIACELFKAKKPWDVSIVPVGEDVSTHLS